MFNEVYFFGTYIFDFILLNDIFMFIVYGGEPMFSFVEIIFLISCFMFCLIVMTQTSSGNSLSGGNETKSSSLSRFGGINKLSVLLIVLYFSMSVLINIESSQVKNIGSDSMVSDNGDNNEQY
jgi:preprotein translocase subunit SecG